MKTLISLACVTLLLSGCTLRHQMPKASISFNPQTHQIDIQSGKDVILTNVVVTFCGTNASITIGYYQAAFNTAVVNAAVAAQAQQIKGIQDAMAAIIAAAISGAK